jgi:selenide,water dikinase
MLQPQAQAAAILAPHAHAMTDITGFGLVGHLAEMLEADNLGAQLDLSAIPVLEGAVHLAEARHVSALAADNKAALGAQLLTPDTAHAGLLVDPQTAGGLLAAVPAEHARMLVSALRNEGYNAAVIGVIDTAPKIRIVA